MKIADMYFVYLCINRFNELQNTCNLFIIEFKFSIFILNFKLT